jgi:hypothetical protein
VSQGAIPRPYQEGERVMVVDQRGRRWPGFIVRAEPNRKLLVHLDAGGRVEVGRQFVRRDP